MPLTDETAEQQSLGNGRSQSLSASRPTTAPAPATATATAPATADPRGHVHEDSDKKSNVEREKKRWKERGESRPPKPGGYRSIPPAPPRQLFLVSDAVDDPYTALLGPGVRPRSAHSHTGAGRAKGGNTEADGDTARVAFPNTTSPNAPRPSRGGNRRGSGLKPPETESAAAATSHPNADSDAAEAAAVAAAAAAADTPPPRGSRHEGTDSRYRDRAHQQQGDEQRQKECAHVSAELSRRIARRLFAPVELQVESLSTFVVKAVFVLWYFTLLACVVVEVVPQAQWSVTNLCGRGLKTDLQHWGRWTSSCVTVNTTTSSPSAPVGSADVTWAGSHLGVLNDRLKLYPRVSLSLPRSDNQTAKTQTYTVEARVRAEVLDRNGVPVATPAPTNAFTYTVELRCETANARCRLVRLPGEVGVVIPDAAHDVQLEVTLIALPAELVDAVTMHSAAVGVVYQKRAYTLGVVVWRYVFLLLSLLHLLRFVLCYRYTSSLYEQSWVMILQGALFWYLNPLYACNIVTRPLPVILAFLEFRLPTYFIAITIAFMFSVMTASIYWTQWDGEKRDTSKKPEACGCNAAEGGEAENEASPLKDTSSSDEDCDSSEESGQKGARRAATKPRIQRRFSLRRLGAALFASRNVYDPPVWTKAIAILYLLAVLTLDIVDAALEPANWSAGSNSELRFRETYWTVIALLLFGGVVCLCMLFYVGRYLGDKPYLESRPQQLACRVFLMIFFATVFYYVLHCVVFYVRYNRSFAATASRTPFLQLPAIMVACGFTNIMTLVYTSRNRHEGVPIHPRDQRWKHMVWPDTWYRWLARRGGSQYIFFTEEEETRFYKIQIEFRTRQFMAKQKRRHTASGRGGGLWEGGSRANARVNRSFADYLSYSAHETPLASCHPDDELLSLTDFDQPPRGEGRHNEDSLCGQHDLAVNSNAEGAAVGAGGAPPPLLLPLHRGAEATLTRSPADYHTHVEAETSPALTLLPTQTRAAKQTAAGSDGEGGALHDSFRDDDDSNELRRARTLRAEDIRALYRAQEQAKNEGDGSGRRGRKGGNKRDDARQEEDGGGIRLSRTQVFEPLHPRRTASARLTINDASALLQRIHGKSILNMDRFSTYYLADHGEDNDRRDGSQMRKDLNATRGSLGVTWKANSVDLEALGESCRQGSNTARRRSHFQQRGGGAKDDLLVFSRYGDGGDDARVPLRSQSALVSRHTGGGGDRESAADVPWSARTAEGVIGRGRRSSTSGSPGPSSATRLQKHSFSFFVNGSRGAGGTGADSVAPHARTTRDLKRDDGETESSDDDGGDAVLRAYEQFLPDDVIDGVHAGDGERRQTGVGSMLFRGISLARDRLGELVGAAERNLIEKPILHLDKYETKFVDAAYKPFQSASYLPFFNLETAIDCYNLSWEAYGVEESVGDARIETGLRVAPENVPRAAVRGVKTVFCGCCAASESDGEDGEDGGEGVRRARTADAAEEVEPVASGAAGSNHHEDADGDANEENTVRVQVDMSPSSPTPHPERRGEGRRERMALSPAASAGQAAAAASAGLLPIDCEKYGFKLLFVMEAKAVQVLICKMDTDAPEHKGKAPRILISFRGTANLSNAKHDANMHRVVWKEMEEPLSTRDDAGWEGNEDVSVLASTVQKTYLGCASCCRSLLAKTSWRPTCHAGFLVIWRAMREQVMTKLLSVLREDSGTVYRVFTTGHSLGGALASLCAYSVHRALTKMDYPIPDVTVYTYGQPCIGNRTFRRIYDKAVPRSFRIMNESDMVVSFRMFGGYHVGIEVAIDRSGNYIVKPTDMERMFRPTKGRGMSLLNHLMTNYGVSMNAVAERTTCPARGLGCYLTADAEKVQRIKKRAEAQQALLERA